MLGLWRWMRNIVMLMLRKVCFGGSVDLALFLIISTLISGAAFANQMYLKKAVQEFKKALSLDPSHQNAKVYLQKCEEKIAEGMDKGGDEKEEEEREKRRRRGKGKGKGKGKKKGKGRGRKRGKGGRGKEGRGKKGKGEDLL